jgi:hypothetical protein
MIPVATDVVFIIITLSVVGISFILSLISLVPVVIIVVTVIVVFQSSESREWAKGTRYDQNCEYLSTALNESNHHCQGENKQSSPRRKRFGSAADAFGAYPRPSQPFSSSPRLRLLDAATSAWHSPEESLSLLVIL